jgi:hypothetical protein
VQNGQQDGQFEFGKRHVNSLHCQANRLGRDVDRNGWPTPAAVRMRTAAIC